MAGAGDIRAGKTATLRDIVSRMGRDATPAQIREQAYREGFGAINTWMLVQVRNELWPDRPKHSCGYPSVARIGKKRICYERAINLTEKQCTYCHRVLPIDKFSLRADSSLFRRPGCKQCYADKWSVRCFRKTLAEFGVDEKWYEATLESQGGVCAICKGEDCGRQNKTKDARRRRFSIDHCHRTGRVRGLLCNRCNLAIGNFDDDLGRMIAAIAYLQKHKREAAESTEANNG